ncbi:DUF4097 family beta strand repeat protein [Bacillus sp. FJAT-49705]|uniref:DUF4097 family beta strand repeat protein n=1 Tax=Cytobacillus citreus TaxID=2833586 RepID=A0ABS5NS29_9BACI|nr:DUF4097 family beta strand repeat-containing protein [Cytobacillus citreus]MBS4190637.1 DUF4097 family beta strand repeat protein [Cytobacillus citreus]
MKRILFIFLVLVGLYILMTSNVTSLLTFGKSDSEVKVTNNIDLLEVNVSAANANIIPEKRNNVKAELNGKGNLSIDKSGDTIIVEYKQSWLKGFQFFNKAPELNIYIPEDYNRSIDIDIGSGYLTFSGTSKKQPIELEELTINMSSGKVDLKNIKTEEFNHEGSSGVIDVDNLNTGTGSIDMSSGIIKIRNYQGKLDAEVSSGLLDVQMDQLTDSLDLKASSGQIKLNLPDHADFTLNGKKTSGFIDCEFPLKNKITEKNKITGVYGTGEHVVDVSISSGLVKVY